MRSFAGLTASLFAYLSFFSPLSSGSCLVIRESLEPSDLLGFCDRIPGRGKELSFTQCDVYLIGVCPPSGTPVWIPFLSMAFIKN